jgi:shikimate kinase
MGSGKTTVGRLLAQRTGRRFIDTDEAIQALTGKSVRELWEQGGEAAYRDLESRAVLEGLAGDDRAVVVAAPGGAVLDPRVRASLSEPGVLVVWLRTDPDVLSHRVHAGDHRPLLGDHPGEVLSHMAAERAELYASVADAVVDTDGIDPQRIVDRVVRRLEAEGG